MDTNNASHHLPDALRRLIVAALEADVSPGRIEDLIRLEGRRQPGHCPECDSNMSSDQAGILRCTNCGVTSAKQPNQ